MKNAAMSIIKMRISQIIVENCFDDRINVKFITNNIYFWGEKNVVQNH